jgi:hypothetical protein
MYLEAKEIARLYKLLADNLGSDTTEAIFKYINNKIDRSLKATIKTLATKEEVADARKKASEHLSVTKKWILIFWISQAAATLAIIALYAHK